VKIIRQHPLISAFLGYVVITLFPTIDSYWDLVQKVQETNMHVDWYKWLLPLLPFIGAVFLILVLREVRTGQKVTKPTKDKKVETAAITNTSDTSPVITQQEYSQLRAYQNQYDYDKYHLRDKIIVRNGELLQHRLDPIMGGALEFGFGVFNGSVLPNVKIENTGEGRLTLQGGVFYHKPEIANTSLLTQGVWGNIVLKQGVLPEVVKEILSGAKQPNGIELTFDFRNVQIYAQEKGSSNIERQNTLELPNTLKYRVKRDEQCTIADFYDWELVS
jgi:hypothetical protein